MTNINQEKIYLYSLINTGLFANASLRKLRKLFGNFENIYKASKDDLSLHISEGSLTKYLNFRESHDIYSDFEKLSLKNISLIMNEENSFPPRLREIPDAPVALLVNGRLPNPNIPSVAIIGARGCSNYGSFMAAEYASTIASTGIQIISGMASGIDGIAGSAALNAGGHSFAVLGCGPDVCYPQSNQQLFDRLKEKGGIISEYALGSSGVKWHFPVRNRIISGLCDALLVIEAKEKSGTIITVDAALEQGKEVYALPGRTCDALSAGCNQLIRQGAGMLISPEEFLSEYLQSISDKEEYKNFFTNTLSNASLNNKKIVFSSAKEKTIYESLDYNSKSIDEIMFEVCTHFAISLPDLMSHLTNLCIRGLIESVSGTNYRKL